jgi:hypothetical protein
MAMKTGHRCVTTLAVCSLFALAAACGGDDDGGASDGDLADAAANVDAAGEPDAGGGGEADAMPANLDCVGNELPPEAPEMVTLSGGTFSIDITSQGDPVEGAIIELHRASNDRKLDDNAPGGTPADGTFSLTGRTRGNPLEVYLHAEAEGLVTTRLYPPIPVFSDVPMIPLPMFSPIVVNFLSPDQEPENGIVVVIVLDCVGQPITGATVSSTPEAGDVIYADNMGVPDDAATSTGAQGLAFLINVPAGPVTVNATSGGEALLGHDVASVPGEVTTTIILPGPPAL